MAYLSNCCGVYRIDDDSDICPECHEHCDWGDDEAESEETMEDRITRINEASERMKQAKKLK